MATVYAIEPKILVNACVEGYNTRVICIQIAPIHEQREALRIGTHNVQEKSILMH